MHFIVYTQTPVLQQQKQDPVWTCLDQSWLIVVKTLLLSKRQSDSRCSIGDFKSAGLKVISIASMSQGELGAHVK